MTQKYILEVRKMLTCDECDLAAGWSAIVDEKDLGSIDLTLPPQLIDKTLDLANSPFTNVRPMTDTEISDWRKGNDD